MKQSVTKVFYSNLSCVLILVFGLFASCSGPRGQLTADQRQHDMDWVIQVFQQNYAPTQLKEKNFAFKFDQLAQEYKTKAGQDMSNEEFYQLLLSFVAQFKDAHTSGSLPGSSLPGRVKIAYLGFKGKRQADYFVVKELLPTIQTGSAYPVKKNDKILKMDGIAVKQLTEDKITPYRNLGLDEANTSFLMPKLFSFTSLELPLPKEDLTTELEIKRGTKIITVNLPWVVKDYKTFREEQAKAIAEKNKSSTLILNKFLQVSELVASTPVPFYLSQSQLLNVLNLKKETAQIHFDLLQAIGKQTYNDSFSLRMIDPLYDYLELAEELISSASSSELSANSISFNADDMLKKLKKARNLPANTYAVSGSKILPAAIMLIKPKADAALERVAYLRIPSFSLSPAEAVLKELKNHLKFFKNMGIKKMVLDLIDNGGGSLTLGLQMAQMFSSELIDMPKIQFKISKTWLDQFETQSINGLSDAERDMAKEMLARLEGYQRQAMDISAPITATALMPFKQVPNMDLKVGKTTTKKSFDIVLLANEGCASMCDIFTAMMQDNKLATIMGGQTMGAGGNVVQHYSALNSGLSLSQTESLIVRSNGEYLENNGVKPDVQYDLTKYRATKFGMAISDAAKKLFVTEEEKKLQDAKPETEKTEDKTPPKSESEEAKNVANNNLLSKLKTTRI